MKRQSLDVEDTHGHEKKRRINRKRQKRLLEEQCREYGERVAKLDPTVADDLVRESVMNRMPISMNNILQGLGFASSYYEKYVPTQAIADLVTSIVVDAVNKPVRNLINDYILHYEELTDLSERRKASPSRTLTLADELCSMPLPNKDEEPFSEFCERLLGIMLVIIERVAGAIQRKELLNGSRAARIIMSKIEMTKDIKRKLCKLLYNEIALFAGEPLYTLFIEDTKQINELVNNAISE
uniref:Wsv310-like protein n=1 Tax=Metapenaeus ensis nimavirus TaxID=2133794 RepID=A0A401IPG5_9VIRU|nr:MAG: wsv310-like protein [Metapenaeus ensis nimavirus]GBG35491.1 wsv310-like protein [Metapenaeus ensis nimavirus]